MQVRVWQIVSVPGQSAATVHWPVTLTVAVGASDPKVAVIVALAAPDATLVALKVACVLPARTVTPAGTVTAAESEESVTTVSVPGDAASVTVMIWELRAVILLLAGVSVMPGRVTVMV